MVTRYFFVALATAVAVSACDPFDSRQTYTGRVFDVSGTCHAMFDKISGKVYAFKPGIVGKKFGQTVTVKAAIAKSQTCPGAILLDDVEVQ